MNFFAVEVGIRRMAPADLDRVVEIAQSLNDAPHWPLAAYLTALGKESVPRRISLVATAPDSAIVGFVVATLLAPQAELESIAVVTEGQRRGVARRLFTELTQELRRAQVTEVILEVRASNHPALGLYRCLGFKETGRRPRYYADPEEDAVLMNLQLG